MLILKILKGRIALPVVAIVAAMVLGVVGIVSALTSVGTGDSAPGGSFEQGTPAGVLATANEQIPFTVEFSPVVINIEPNDADTENFEDIVTLVITDDGVHDITISILNLGQLKDNFEHLALCFEVGEAPSGSTPDAGKVLMALTFEEPKDTTRVLSGEAPGTWKFDIKAFWKVKEQVDDIIPIILKVNVEPA